MYATLNTFPPVQSMSSPRGWILAAIALIHLGFFYVLSSGLMPDIFPKQETRARVVMIPRDEPIDPTPPPRLIDIEPDTREIFVPTPELPLPPEDVAPPQTDLRIGTTVVPPETRDVGSGPSVATPVLKLPEIDMRRPLSEPTYPSRAIRENRTGTVVLSVFVLADGRVGDVRLEQSSGSPDLDDSALREAKRWRLKPGTKDGVAFGMWKQIPITFQLKVSAK
jgi:protein TonB